MHAFRNVGFSGNTDVTARLLVQRCGARAAAPPGAAALPAPGMGAKASSDGRTPAPVPSLDLSLVHQAAIPGIWNQVRTMYRA